jgi:anti-sigma B factor antagonist
MAVKENMVGDVAVVTISGKLMGGKETWEVHTKIKNMIENGTKKVVVDISKVKWMNSQGLGMLMSCYSSLKNAEGQLKVAGATEKVNSLFMITQMITIFDTYETADRAVASFTS